MSAGVERLLVEWDSFKWREAIAGGGKRSQVEGWSQVEGSDRW